MERPIYESQQSTNTQTRCLSPIKANCIKLSEVTNKRLGFSSILSYDVKFRMKVVLVDMK